MLAAAGADLGAGWNKTSDRTGKAYVSVSLKSPFLPGQLYCALVWNEPKAKAE